jgi:AcrR family transcriptional regulator
MARPAKFSREQLQEAALALVDEQGAAALSMRALAQALGTGAMTLYNHVADRADLEALVVDAVLGEARWSPGPHADWRDEVENIAHAMWSAVRAHPHAIPLIVTRRSRSRVVFEVSEALLAALARSGRSRQQLLIAFRAVQAYVTGFAQVALEGPLAEAAGEAPEEVIGRFSALSEAQFPRLVEVARAAASSRADVEFRAGLRALLVGLASARAPARRVPKPRRRR